MLNVENFGYYVIITCIVVEHVLSWNMFMYCRGIYMYMYCCSTHCCG